MEVDGTFVLALVGAVAGVAALAWSILEFIFAGAWVTVRIDAGWMGPGGAVTSDEAPVWSEQPDPAFPTPMIAVAVVNRGRHPTTVRSVEFSAGGFSFVPLASRIGQSLQYRSERHSAESWHLDAREAAAAQRSSMEVMRQPAHGVRAVAKPATGKERRSRNVVWLP